MPEQAVWCEDRHAWLDLPPAISGHNSWFLWGPGECLGKPTLLVIARDRERLDKLFAIVEPGAEFHCRDCARSTTSPTGHRIVDLRCMLVSVSR